MVRDQVRADADAAYAAQRGEAVEDIVWDTQRRADMAWDRYHEFRENPGDKCGECWLLQKFCCCAGLQGIKLRQRVIVVWHYAELDRRRGSNTAKLLLQFGAEILVWGVREHEEKLQALLAAELENSVVLFPAPGAMQASEYAVQLQRRELPRCIVVLDGGWKETRKINQAIDQRVTRCCVNVSREECQNTRKYKAKECRNRVQTAAAFVALMKELGEAEPIVDELRAGLACFTEAFERQLHWSGVALESRNVLPQEDHLSSRTCEQEIYSGS